MKKAIIIIIGIILTLISLPYALQFILYESWTTVHVYIQWVVLIFVVSLYIWIWYNIISYIRHGRLANIKKQIIMGTVPILTSVIFIGTHVYDEWMNRDEVISAEVDLYEYMPFSSKKLATLNESPTVTIEEPLPKLDGATALYPIYASFAQALYPQKEYDLYTSEVSCNTTPQAYERLLKKEVDIIFVAAPSEKQKETFANAEEELEVTPIGKEGFVFFVNSDNPVEGLSIQQIQDIYQGKITNWKEVGGKDEEIRAFQRPEGSGSQSALLRLMKGLPLMESLKENTPTGMGAIISETANYRNSKNALGFSFRFYANEMVGNNQIKLLMIDGVPPTPERIRDESYPITNSFYAITLKSNKNPKVKQLLEWMVSDQGKELVEKTGYISE